METIELDVDPEIVAASVAARKSWQRRMFDTYGTPKRCETNTCNHDGSCVYCGADQGVTCRSIVKETSSGDD